jgi:potassium/hydrogen antiporter
MSLELGMIVTGSLLLASILASKASSRLGIPALLFFILFGMLAGSEGLGGIEFDFDQVELARNAGSLALAFILFAGGLETRWLSVRPVLWSGISLATLGVAATAVVVGLAAHYLMGLPPLVALLMGAIVSSTDAAAVFGVLRTRGITLKKNLGPLLELESGSNDPMAIFLTVGVTGLLVGGTGGWEALVFGFAQQMTLGAVVGHLLGIGAAWFINRVRLEYGGLYPAITIGLALLAYGGASVVGGNPFLSVYVCGLTLGSRNFVHRQSLMSFHDGLAWLMQIAMFLVLGLLAFPSRLVPLASSGLLLSAVLILIARPVAVFIGLASARWLGVREKLFVSWVGLRGAVPIILATFPLSAGIPQAETIFHIVFFAVLTSVLIQGTFIPVIADWLQVSAPGSTSAEHTGQNTVEVRITDFSPAVNRQVVDLQLPQWALLLLVTRGGESFVPQGSTVLQAGDLVVLATRKEDIDDLAALLAGHLRI